MKRQTFTGVLLAICIFLLMGSMPSVTQTSAADNDPPPPWPLIWVEMAPMPTPRYSTGVAVSRQQTIYVIGGDNCSCVPLTTVEEYDPETNSWRARAALPTGRWNLGAATGADGRIYAVGGQGGEPCGANVLGTVEVYDPRFDTWTTCASMPTPRSSLGVVAGANGKIYAIGGEDQTGILDIVEEYDPISDTWTQKADMPYAQSHFASVSASNGRIYVMGGLNVSAEAVWEFDPVADTWVEKAPMPTGRYTFGAGQVKNGLIYAVGGVNWTGDLNVIEAYDTATDIWTPATDMASLHGSPAVAAVHKFVYAIGGWGIRADGSEGPIGLVEAAKTPNVNRPKR